MKIENHNHFYHKMEEVNPLLMPTLVSESKSSKNKRGRPTIEKTIKFNALPKSVIISQILSKRAISCKVGIDQHLTQPESEDNSLDAADSPQSTEQTLLNECRAINKEKDHTYTKSHLNDSAINEEKDHTYTKSHLNDRAINKEKDHTYTKSHLNDGAINKEKDHTYTKSHLNDGAINKEKDHTYANSHLNDKVMDKLHYCNYPNCAYTCKLSCNLIKHKRTHTDEKPYLCDKCTFRSNFVNSLKVHKRIHTSERPHGCKHCTYRCNSSSNLKKHYLHRHPEVSKTL